MDRWDGMGNVCGLRFARLRAGEGAAKNEETDGLRGCVSD